MKSEKIRILKGSTSLFLAVFIYSFYGIFSRIVGIEFGQVFQITARFSLMFLFFLSYVLIKKKWKKIEKEDYKWFFLMTIPGMLAIILMFIAFNFLPFGTAYFTLHASLTISSYFLGYFLFKERINRIKLYSLILGLFGLYLIFSDSFKEGSLFYLFLMVISGLGAATWNIVSKKVSTKYSINQVLLIDSIVLIVISLPIAIILKEPISLPNLSTPWLGIFVFAIAGVVASIMTIKGYKYLQAQIGSLISLIEPFFAILLGWLFYKEALTMIVFTGGILTIIAASLPSLLKYKQKF